MERIVLFWMLVVVLLTGTICCLVSAWRGKSRLNTRAGACDAIDYLREQRASLEADLGSGLLTPAAFEASVEELECAALQTSEVRPESILRTIPRWSLLLFLFLFFALSSWGLYQSLGSSVLMRLQGQESAVGLLRSDGSVRENTVRVNESDLKTYLSEKPFDERAWVLLARSQAERGAYEEAFHSYQKALGLEGKVSRDVEVMVECAATSMSRRTKAGYRDALTLFKEIVAVEGESPRICELATIASFEAEDWTSAVRYLEYILASMPGDSARYERARRALLYAKQRQQTQSPTSRIP